MGRGDININLPDGDSFAPSTERVEEMERLLSPEIITLGRPASDRSSWEKLRSTIVGLGIREKADEFLAEDPVPRLTEEIWWYTAQTRQRDRIDPLILSFRGRINAFSMAACLWPEGPYFEALLDEVDAILGLPNWCFPLHIEEEDFRSGKLHSVDLQAVHCAANLAHVLATHKGRLEPRHEESIRTAIMDRVIHPYVQRIESGKDVYWWVVCNHNWNTVCVTGILYAALSLLEDRRLRAWHVALAEKLLAYTEQGFEKSGFYTEGVSYWNYGFGYYVLAAELIRMATGGTIDWLQRPEIRRMALFGARMEVQKEVFPSFADCSSHTKPVPWLRNWLNNRIDPARQNRSCQVLVNSVEGMNFIGASLLELVAFQQMDPAHAYALEYPLVEREWFEDVQYLICRPSGHDSPALAATFKGGHNGVNHNHNDLGTFTIVLEDEELVVDPGMEKYTARTFSQHRYMGNLLNSFGHSVPVVAGQLQRPGQDEHSAGYGSDFFAHVLATSFTTAEDRIVLDLAPAYQLPVIARLEREFRYQRRPDVRVIVTDVAEFLEESEFEVCVLTYSNWQKLDANRLALSGKSGGLVISVECAESPLIFSDTVLQESSTPTRLAWRLAHPVRVAKVRMVVTSRGDSDTGPTPPEGPLSA